MVRILDAHIGCQLEDGSRKTSQSDVEGSIILRLGKGCLSNELQGRLKEARKIRILVLLRTEIHLRRKVS